MKHIWLMLFALMFICQTSQAQFFKKLKQKVQQTVENTVTDNVAEKAAQETDKSLDNLWEGKMGNGLFAMGGEQVPYADIPESYDFDWEYVVEMETKQGNLNLNYYLKNQATYFGTKMEQAGEMFMVMDTKNKFMLMFMSNNKNNIVMGTKINEDALHEDGMETYNNAEIRKLGTKNILGYECQGYETETEDYLVTFYVTDKAPVSFNSIFSAKNQKQVPPELVQLMKKENGLMLEMYMQDKKNKRNNVKMFATSLEKKSMKINKADYSPITSE
mgnify:CR=1 FL=1|tara:strand:+ start:441 stop:1262 length:822 start_codon:yes stop_codon:yes gene_type:complete